ncbi:hypothetical protein DFH06DRAFT_432915 [Mycena polygramma]|nr:hypothetical protein DFH06DRAFT_432915 [Mycena polygramma]
MLTTSSARCLIYTSLDGLSRQLDPTRSGSSFFRSNKTSAWTRWIRLYTNRFPARKYSTTCTRPTRSKSESTLGPLNTSTILATMLPALVARKKRGQPKSSLLISARPHATATSSPPSSFEGHTHAPDDDILPRLVVRTKAPSSEVCMNTTPAYLAHGYRIRSGQASFAILRLARCVCYYAPIDNILCGILFHLPNNNDGLHRARSFLEKSSQRSSSFRRPQYHCSRPSRPCLWAPFSSPLYRLRALHLRLAQPQLLHDQRSTSIACSASDWGTHAFRRPFISARQTQIYTQCQRRGAPFISGHREAGRTRPRRTIELRFASARRYNARCTMHVSNHRNIPHVLCSLVPYRYSGTSRTRSSRRSTLAGSLRVVELKRLLLGPSNDVDRVMFR